MLGVLKTESEEWKMTKEEVEALVAEAAKVCDDRFHALTARLNAVSHVLAMTLVELRKHDPGLVERISLTTDERLREYLAGDDNDFARNRAVEFRTEVDFILKDRESRARLEKGLPRPLS